MNWEQASDRELKENALNLWANYVETGNPILSATDMQNQRKPVRALGEDGMRLVLRLRALARKERVP